MFLRRGRARAREATVQVAGAVIEHQRQPGQDGEGRIEDRISFWRQSHSGPIRPKESLAAGRGLPSTWKNTRDRLDNALSSR